MLILLKDMLLLSILNNTRLTSLKFMKNTRWLPKRDAFLKMIKIYVGCFVLSVYSKLFNVDSVRGHVAVNNIIDDWLF